MTRPNVVAGVLVMVLASGLGFLLLREYKPASFATTERTEHYEFPREEVESLTPIKPVPPEEEAGWMYHRGDGSILKLRALVGDCEPFSRAFVHETRDWVAVAVLIKRRADAPDVCTDQGIYHDFTRELEADLGDREVLKWPVEGPDPDPDGEP